MRSPNSRRNGEEGSIHAVLPCPRSPLNLTEVECLAKRRPRFVFPWRRRTNPGRRFPHRGFELRTDVCTVAVGCLELGGLVSKDVDEQCFHGASTSSVDASSSSWTAVRNANNADFTSLNCRVNRRWPFRQAFVENNIREEQPLRSE